MTALSRIALCCFCTTGVAQPLWAEQLKIDETGVNGNEAPVLFTQSDLAALFPGFWIEPAFHPNPYGAEKTVYQFGLKKGLPIFWADVGYDEVYTFSIWTESPLVQGPSGVRIGKSTVRDLLERSETWDCVRGYNQQRDTVSCMWWDESLRLLFSFDPSGFERIEEGTYSNQLSGAVLTEIRQYLSRPVQ